MPKCTVYKFGAVWFWKCAKPYCHGGRSHTWRHAFEVAFDHAHYHKEVGR